MAKIDLTAKCFYLLYGDVLAIPSSTKRQACMEAYDKASSFKTNMGHAR